MRSKKIYLGLALAIIALLGLHVLISHRYTDTMYFRKLNPNSQFYVFNEEGYKLLSVSMNDVASRMALLYSVYTPVNTNIPSINFDRLIRSLEGISALDPLNIQPYLTVSYYWSWSKIPENRILMTNYLIPAVDRFPESWDIPYTVFRFKKELLDSAHDADPDADPAPAPDPEAYAEARAYLDIASARARMYGGPIWIVDYPAILLHRDGQTLEAFYWLISAIEKTDNPKQVEVLRERMATLWPDLPEELREELKGTEFDFSEQG